MLKKVKLKRIIAAVAFALGFSFTLLALLSIWETPGFVLVQPTTASKLIPTLGLLTAAFLALLAIIKMTEEKK